ncbi:MAG: acyl-CoA thioesterase [Panacibacter sp.]
MNDYIKEVEVRWSDMDPNFHLRHSVYYDWGAYLRLSYLSEHSITPALLQQLHFGPILFREECVFKREIVFGDSVAINVAVSKSRHDMSRWSMVHEVWKNREVLSAIITVDGAWIDTKIRKLAVPTEMIRSVFEAMPKTTNFEWTD